jgi:hypothetical protein
MRARSIVVRCSCDPQQDAPTSCAITGRDGDDAFVTGARQPIHGIAFCSGCRTTRRSNKAQTVLQKGGQTLFPTRRSTTSVVGLASSYPGGHACQRTGGSPQLYIPANCYNRLCPADLNAKLASVRPTEKSELQFTWLAWVAARPSPRSGAQHHWILIGKGIDTAGVLPSLKACSVVGPRPSLAASISTSPASPCTRATSRLF